LFLIKNYCNVAQKKNSATNRLIQKLKPWVEIIVWLVITFLIAEKKPLKMGEKELHTVSGAEIIEYRLK
jgi:hypothetical protein